MHGCKFTLCIQLLGWVHSEVLELKVIHLLFVSHILIASRDSSLGRASNWRSEGLWFNAVQPWTIPGISTIFVPYFPLLFGVIILFQFNSHFASFEFSLSFTAERFRTVVTIKGPFSLVNHSFAFIIFFSFLCRTKDQHDNTDLSYPL